MAGRTERIEGETAGRVLGFEDFFELEYLRLFGTLCLVTGDRSEAEELMQDAFLQVWERWDRVGAMDHATAYLYRTAFNLFRSRLRRARRAARRVVLPRPSEDAYSRVDEQDWLVRALRALPPRQRAAVVLTELLDLPSDEAARTLGVRPVTVRVLASQGRASLKALLEEGDG